MFTLKMKKWSLQWAQFMQLCKEAWKKFRTSTGFEPVTSRFAGAMLYQLSYEATDIGSRSIVGSYVPVKEMSVNDIWDVYIYISLTMFTLFACQSTSLQSEFVAHC